MPHTTPYTARIRSIAPNANPAHVEAMMRSEHSTLDHLSPSAFAREVRIAVMCVDEAGPDLAARIAASYGLTA